MRFKTYGRKTPFCFVTAICLLLPFSGLLAQDEQDEIDSSFLFGDTLDVGGTDSVFGDTVFYQHYNSFNQDSLSYLKKTSIDYDATGRNIACGPADLLKSSPEFEMAEAGPFGHTRYQTFYGLPLEEIRLGDFRFDYSTFGLPANSFIDTRLLSLSNADRIIYDRMISADNFNSIYFERMPAPDSNAFSSAMMQKGDYGFSNTLVRFATPLGYRANLGLAVGNKQSDGYLADWQKDAESYRIYGNYQLNDNYQLQSDLLFSSISDQHRFLTGYNGYQGNSEIDWFGYSLALASSDSARYLRRSAFVYQEFSETVRGFHDKFSREQKTFRLILENDFTLGKFRTIYQVEPYYCQAKFDSDYDFPGLRMFSQSHLRLSESFTTALSLSTGFDKYRDTRLSVTLGNRLELADSLQLNAQVFRISRGADENELFSATPLLQFTDEDGLSLDYIQSGNDDLPLTVYQGIGGSLDFEREQFGFSLFSKYAQIEDFIYWTDIDPSSDLALITPQTSDLKWLNIGSALKWKLPYSFELSGSYSYNYLEDEAETSSFALVPRHNLYGSLSKHLYIAKLNLHVDLLFETEYHSTNYKSIYNPEELGRYAIANFQIHFNIKSFTLFYSMDNIFSNRYRTFYDYDNVRAVWWGFRWNFIN